MIDIKTLERLSSRATDALLSARNSAGHWTGELSSSALSTATAVGALSQIDAPRFRDGIEGGLKWLVENRNSDEGWGDTVLSRSNISTTLLGWSAFALGDPENRYARVVAGAERWIESAAGSSEPDALAASLGSRYGQDRTFSAPILTMCALAGKLGSGERAWKHVYPLPFELACCPHRLLKWLGLPVVSYALPALIAMGHVRHHHLPSRNPVVHLLRSLTQNRTLQLLEYIQPASGGYLEAAPLTSFVMMSLAACGLSSHPVVSNGIRFLLSGRRQDGSWPIDTNLSTWVTTLSINGLGSEVGRLPDKDRPGILEWLLAQQFREEHPYTHSEPGGWAWTDLPGGVPDADDTAGVLLALAHLAAPQSRARQPAVRRPLADARGSEGAAQGGVSWLLRLQNRDGGIPTFCKGWGKLPFDRSSPDLTAHALRAWMCWKEGLPGEIQTRVDRAIRRAVDYLLRTQQSGGSWEPLWFGNEAAPNQSNRTYGTARVSIALLEIVSLSSSARQACRKAVLWLLSCQNSDGGWGGDLKTPSSIEETALAMEALARSLSVFSEFRDQLQASLSRALHWIDEATAQGSKFPPAPIGLYFAKLWYFERLYPLIFTISALRAVRRPNSIG